MWRWLQIGARTSVRLGVGLAAAALLVGCGLPRKIDSDVQSFIGAPGAVAPASYRFERLPSQVNAAYQAQLEALAVTALAKVGLTQDSAQPKYSLQISVQVVRYPQSQRQPRMHGMFDLGHRPDGTMFTFMAEPVWYGHSVQVLLRDAATNQLAFETSARFDGPWSDTATLLPAILDAALAGYPNPPIGPRKVVIELPASPTP
jgi:hypothetical protein